MKGVASLSFRSTDISDPGLELGEVGVARLTFWGALWGRNRNGVREGLGIVLVLV